MEIELRYTVVQPIAPRASSLFVQMSATYGISWVFVCLALFTATNGLRGALFRAGKRFWSSGVHDPYIIPFEQGKSLKMTDVMDYNSENQNDMSNIRGIKKTVYLL